MTFSNLYTVSSRGFVALDEMTYSIKQIDHSNRCTPSFSVRQAIATKSVAKIKIISCKSKAFSQFETVLVLLPFISKLKASERRPGFFLEELHINSIIV